MHAPPFDTVRADTFSSCAATPEGELDFEFVGVRVAAPVRVDVWTALAFDEVAAPLAGLITAEPSSVGADDPLGYLTLLAVDHRGRSYRGRLDIAPRTGGATPSLTTTHYFNVDLAETLDLPPVPAVYFVYAFLGPYVSNVVRVEVVDPDEAAP